MVIRLDFSFKLGIKDGGVIVTDRREAGFRIAAEGAGDAPNRVIMERQSGDKVAPFFARKSPYFTLHAGAQAVVFRSIVREAISLPSLARGIPTFDQFHHPGREVTAFPRCSGNGMRSGFLSGTQRVGKERRTLLYVCL
jgi:hypothetical protein